eukprot:TRINITY_DN66791_c3_g1_i1.p4 TRINITY_DN66791_c3_g1~~TRINITY_DN66791_c3_g1_i1.p4  ORF type:complete len:114 (+),score=5.81 TRINITY_DN66791_c3_g1_i1:533-874(+)
MLQMQWYNDCFGLVRVLSLVLSCADSVRPPFADPTATAHCGTQTHQAEETGKSTKAKQDYACPVHVVLLSPTFNQVATPVVFTATSRCDVDVFNCTSYSTCYGAIICASTSVA